MFTFITLNNLFCNVNVQPEQKQTTILSFVLTFSAIFPLCSLSCCFLIFKAYLAGFIILIFLTCPFVSLLSAWGFFSYFISSIFVFFFFSLLLLLLSLVLVIKFQVLGVRF